MNEPMNEPIVPSKIHFVKVGNGRLALNHRPRSVDFPHLRALGCTHLVTLLREDEGAGKFRELSKSHGINWIGLAVPNGKYPEGEVHERLVAAMPELSRLLDEGNSLMIHCSAGIHRTGMVSYALLRWRGLSPAQAMNVIGQMRKETAEGMMDKRKVWGDRVALLAPPPKRTWFESLVASARDRLTGLLRPRQNPGKSGTKK